MGIVVTKDKISDYELEKLLVKAFADESSSMDVIKELASIFFPKSDIQSKAKIAKLNDEVEKFAHQSKVLTVQESYNDGEFQRIFIECEAHAFSVWHPKLNQLLEYLTHKYQIDIEFNYLLCEYKGYEDPTKNEETPVPEMPKIPVTFDIDLE